MKTAVPLPAFAPDQTANSGTLLEADNVIARVDGYGPLRAPVAISAALTDEFRGGGSFISGDGTTALIVGTDAGLVYYASGVWTDLITGMTVGGRWLFTQFGEYVIAVNGNNTKVITLTGTPVASTLTNAPNGTCIATIGDYVVIGQNSNDLLGIYTSAVNNHADWDYASTTSTATYQPMLDGGEVMGLASGEYGVILQRQRLVRMSLTGDSTAPFTYDVITPNVGCAAKGSIAQAGRSIFFLSDRGFMAIEDGQSVTPIGSEKIDRTFQALVSRDDYDHIWSAIDPAAKLVFWCVPGGSLWIYNYELGRWTTGAVALDGIFSGFTSSQTLEEVSALYPDLDAMPYSLDDPRFSGGAPKLYPVQAGAVSVFTGDTLRATFQLGFNEFAQGARARFRSVRPATDCTDGNAVHMDVRARLGDGENLVSAGALRDSGVMPIRAAGRHAKVRWEITAGSEWTYAQGFVVEFDAGGER